MKSCWLVVAFAAALLASQGEPVQARGALRGLAAMHGDGDGHADDTALLATPAHEDTSEWVELQTATRDVKTKAEVEAEKVEEAHDEDSDEKEDDHSAEHEEDDSAEHENGEYENGSIDAESFGFDAIAGEAHSDDDVSRGKPSGAVQKGKPVPIGESAAAAKPISEISQAAIKRDPAAYGVDTPAPSTAAVPIGETAAAAKPISKIDPAAIKKDPAAYGVDTPAPGTTNVIIGSSAAAAKSPVQREV